MARRTLGTAQKSKNDEFYTQYEDVEREMIAFLDHDTNIFKGKVVLCPCDDPEWSNFTKYFAQNFEKLGLKKLITTSYAHNSKFAGQSISPQVSEYVLDSPSYNPKKNESHGKLFILEQDTNSSGHIDIQDIEWTYLEGDGDFRSNEVMKLRDEADFIITNPPFSLFREFVAWIMEANKKFMVLGNQNAITYKDFFPLIASDRVWLGHRFNQRVNGSNLTYRVPDHYEMKASELYTDSNGDKFITVPGTGWFTNVDHSKRHQPLELMTMADNLKFSKHSKVREVGYRKYDNYDAIDIPFVDSIPSDYHGSMGVPVTFLGKHCPEQFEIIRFRKGNDGKDLTVDGIAPYFRIIIRRSRQ